MEAEILIQCPHCHVQTRMPMSAVALATRTCPKCGGQVTPVRIEGGPPPARSAPPPAAHLPETQPLAALAGFADDPDEAPTFSFKEEPKPPPAPPPRTIVPSTGGRDVIELRDEDLPPPPAQTFEVPAKAPTSRRVKVKAKLAKLSIWEAVYSFPFRFENLRVFVMLLLALTLVALCGCGMRTLADMLGDQGPGAELSGITSLLHRAAMHVFICLAVFSVFPSLFLAATFLRIIEETSAGVDDVQWPKDPWLDYIGKWVLLMWVFGASAGVWGFALAPAVPLVGGKVYWGVVLLLGWFTFPVVLLSVMAGGAGWMLIYPPLLLAMLKKPLAVIFLYANALLILLPCAILAYAVVGRLFVFLLPMAVPIWAISLFCYARVLGRVGFEFTREK
jgi:hypothetical protein